jgi:hypothetical protein
MNINVQKLCMPTLYSLERGLSVTLVIAGRDGDATEMTIIANAIDEVRSEIRRVETLYRQP